MLRAYFNERRARAIVLNVLPSLDQGVQNFSPIDRAACLAIVNALIESAADVWGKSVLQGPSATAKPKVVDMILHLAERHSRLMDESIDPMRKRNMQDIAYAQAMRELRAIELVVGTYGAVLVPGPKPSVSGTWRMLWSARGAAEAGAQALVAFSKHARAQPFPRSKRRQKMSVADVVAMCSTLPPFLAPKKRAAGAAKTPEARPR